MGASSQDLHPKTGARYVFESQGDGRYAVTVYRPEGEKQAAVLTLDPEALEPEISPSWARAEVLKLARVLRREPREKLVRWRPAAQ